MRKVTRVFFTLLISAAILCAAVFGAFYIIIVKGASLKLQEIWICTAMKTMSHQYLATIFFSDEYIDSVLKANAVDDSLYNSEILEFETESEEKSDPESESESEKALEEASKEQSDRESEMETEAETEAETKDQYLSEGYTLLEDGIYLKEVSDKTWHGFLMLISDPMRVKLVDTSQQFSCGENVMTMTKNAGAVAGMNGGGFQDGVNYDSNGGLPAGMLIEDSKLVYPTEIDDTVYNMIGINKNGALVLRHATVAWALENEIVSAVSFYPFLVVNGEGIIKNGTGGWGIAPRTAIGQRKSGEFLFLVIDGRQPTWSIGCDLDVLQEIMLDEGAYNASMLDGGSSTALVYGQKYINKPSLGHERWINNCFVVMPKSEK